MESGLLFANRSYEEMAKDVAAKGGFEPGRLVTRTFPDGEVYHRVATPVRGRDVALIAGTVSDRDTLEALDLAFALVEQGARSLSIAIPFFGYATMERSWSPGDAVKAVSRARLWSAVPIAPEGNRILILEPHTSGLPFYFGSESRVAALDGLPLMLKMLGRFSGEEIVLCSPDTGRIKWVDDLASRSRKPSAFLLKRRTDEGQVYSLGLLGSVRGRKVVFCDDMIRSGETLLLAGKACLQAGATSLAAAVIHGAFTHDALRKLETDGRFSAILCTDSHAGCRARGSDKLHVEPCSELIAEALRARA
jgi:ribose-phosphate pyrophosphokinase